MTRRSTIVIALLLLALPAAAMAQVQFGIKGGGSFGNVSNRGVLPGNLDTRTGFAAGISLTSAPSILGFGIEGLYAQRGVNSDGTPSDSRRLDYIDVPAYLRVMIPTPGIAPFAYAGPQVSFEVRCREASDVDCPDSGPGGSRRKTDYAAVIGGGVQLGLLTVEGRYIYGLRDLNISTVTTSDSYKTRSFMILGGLTF